MTGVNILYEEAVKTSLGPIQLGVAIASLVFSLIALVLFIINKDLENLIITFLSIGLGLLITFMVMLWIPSLYKQTTRYGVTLSNEVSYKEFTEKYEVIENKGDFYIVEEIGGNNE